MSSNIKLNLFIKKRFLKSCFKNDAVTFICHIYKKIDFLTMTILSLRFVKGGKSRRISGQSEII